MHYTYGRVPYLRNRGLARYMLFVLVIIYACRFRGSTNRMFPQIRPTPYVSCIIDFTAENKGYSKKIFK